MQFANNIISKSFNFKKEAAKDGKPGFGDLIKFQPESFFTSWNFLWWLSKAHKRVLSFLNL